MKIVIVIYLLMSVVTFCVYAWDKYKAKYGVWRTPEKTLHVLELCCGWPGALMAQELLRHKSHKTGYRTSFWLMVTLNVAIVLFLFRGGYA